ncbi:MAG: hypothetical protein QX189_11760, partial [Methylococcales bacterium]
MMNPDIFSVMVHYILTQRCWIYICIKLSAEQRLPLYRLNGLIQINKPLLSLKKPFNHAIVKLGREPKKPALLVQKIRH